MGVNWPILSLILFAAGGLVVMNLIAVRNNRKAREFTSLQKNEFLDAAEFIRLYLEIETRREQLQQWAEIATIEWKWNAKVCYEARPHEFVRENIDGGIMMPDVSEADPDYPYENGILFGYDMREEPVYERHYHSKEAFSELFRITNVRTQEHIRTSYDGKNNSYARLVFNDEQLLSWEELNSAGMRREAIEWKDGSVHRIVASAASWNGETLDTPVETTAYEVDYSAVGRCIGLKVVDLKTNSQDYISLENHQS